LLFSGVWVTEIETRRDCREEGGKGQGERGKKGRVGMVHLFCFEMNSIMLFAQMVTPEQVSAQREKPHMKSVPNSNR
jgi:hypothetical protein